MAQKERPIGVTILAILAGLGALMALNLTPADAPHPAVQLPRTLLPSGISPAGSIFWGFIFLVWLAVHPDALTMHPSGLDFMVIISGLSLLFALLSVMGASSGKPWRQRFSSAASS